MIVPAAAAPVSDRVACDRPGPIQLDHLLLKCRELPFDLALFEDGFVRTDATTIATLEKPFTDGTVWRVAIQPMLEDVSQVQLEARMLAVAKAVEPKLTKDGEARVLVANGGLAHELDFVGGGRALAVRGWFYGGYLVTALVAGRPDTDTGPHERRGRNLVETLQPKGPATTALASLSLGGGSVMIPARAWRYTQWKVNRTLEKASALYALPDLHATLGVRDLRATDRCADIATTEPRAFIASLALGSLTIDTVARVTSGLRVTTADDRPAAYDLLCRDGMLVQIMVRGEALTAPLLEILDRVAGSLGA